MYTTILNACYHKLRVIQGLIHAGFFKFVKGMGWQKLVFFLPEQSAIFFSIKITCQYIQYKKVFARGWLVAPFTPWISPGCDKSIANYEAENM